MASNKTVIVLAPNGRRQNIKVTPNTTILQILEEVCRKQGLKLEEYDLKHHNNVLDTTAIMRFSGLPNNAQLEMCTAQKTRKDGPVLVGLQLENGTRLTGNFTPNDNLWQVVKGLCSEEEIMKRNLVIIYMRREVYGVDELKNTSLRSLGLTGGRAMMRLIHKTPEELKTQANVSAPLPSKPVEEKPYYRKPKDKSPVGVISEDDKETCMKDSKGPKLHFATDYIKKLKKSTPERHLSQEEPMEVDSIETSVGVETPVVKDKGKSKAKPIQDIKLEDMKFLGERDAMIFSLEMVSSVKHEDLPDEFFELTIHDAQKLFHDLKKKREELEESPLQTTAIKNLEQSKRVLRQIGQYKKSVIRIQFPDRTVLQGTFRPLETIEHVVKFVKEYLSNSSLDFYLFTTPPKCVLDPSKTLAEAECVPCALVHFGSNSPSDNIMFLRQELFSQFVSPSIASLAASKLMVKTKREIESREKQRRANDLDENINVGASTSKDVPVLPREDEPKKKAPRWFKPA